MTTGIKTRGTPAERALTRLADDPGLLQAGASGRIRGHPPASRPLPSFPNPTFLTQSSHYVASKSFLFFNIKIKTILTSEFDPDFIFLKLRRARTAIHLCCHHKPGCLSFSGSMNTASSRTQ